jgi:hypothetical protein
MKLLRAFVLLALLLTPALATAQAVGNGRSTFPLNAGAVMTAQTGNTSQNLLLRANGSNLTGTCPVGGCFIRHLWCTYRATGIGFTPISSGMNLQWGIYDGTNYYAFGVGVVPAPTGATNTGQTDLMTQLSGTSTTNYVAVTSADSNGNKGVEVAPLNSIYVTPATAISAGDIVSCMVTGDEGSY